MRSWRSSAPRPMALEAMASKTFGSQAPSASFRWGQGIELGKRGCRAESCLESRRSASPQANGKAIIGLDIGCRGLYRGEMGLYIRYIGL